MQISKFQIVCTQIIRWISIIVIGFLTVLSIINTSIEGPFSYVNENGEEISHNLVRYIDDRIWSVSLFILILTMLLALIYKKCILSNDSFFLIVISCVYFLIVITYLLMTRFGQYSDAGKLQAALVQTMNGDYQAYEIGGYMYKYPFQAGYFLYEKFFYDLFGENGFLVMQIINAIELYIAYTLLISITRLMWKNVTYFAINTIAVCCLLFVPFILYTTVLYGIIPLFMFSILAWFGAIKFVDTYNWWYALISAVSIAVAYQLKGNALVYMTAIIIYVFIHIFDRKKIVLALIPMIIVCYLVSGIIVKVDMKSLTGYELSKGLPVTGVILMGLSEAPIAPGNYNGRNIELAEENNWDYEATKQAGIYELKQRLHYFVDNPTYTIKFFGRKYAAQWNDPLFQCFQLVEGRYDTNNKIIAFFVDGFGRRVIDYFLNGMHSWILLGTLIYLLVYKEKEGMKDMSLILAFLGGFMFHSFWESKALYALYYWGLLFPYASVGYWRIMQNIKKRKF